jgi:hypothetical protein
MAAVVIGPAISLGCKLAIDLSLERSPIKAESTDFCEF